MSHQGISSLPQAYLSQSSQINMILLDGTTETPTVLTFFKNSILNQSEELCREDKNINDMN